MTMDRHRTENLALRIDGGFPCGKQFGTPVAIDVRSEDLLCMGVARLLDLVGEAIRLAVNFLDTPVLVGMDDRDDALTVRGDDELVLPSPSTSPCSMSRSRSNFPPNRGLQCVFCCQPALGLTHDGDLRRAGNRLGLAIRPRALAELRLGDEKRRIGAAEERLLRGSRLVRRGVAATAADHCDGRSGAQRQKGASAVSSSLSESPRKAMASAADTAYR